MADRTDRSRRVGPPPLVSIRKKISLKDSALALATLWVLVERSWWLCYSTRIGAPSASEFAK
jgi:hypothetical protein